uniref:Acid phosphatase-like protein n=1 Tax=Colletotrichum fructicola (strain Nara gc5) TaxID=1213859 RepID=L2FF97_COLFN
MVNAAGGIVIAILVLLLVAGVGWVIFTQLRARRLGVTPAALAFLVHTIPKIRTRPPRPAPSGIVGWFNDKITGFKNRNNRSAAGAYEQPSAGAPRRGFGPLDPDEAWDTRVGHEAETYGPYGNYEEQELGYRGGAGGGDSYNMNMAATPNVHDEPARGRSLSRPGDDLAVPKGGRNPFDDDAEPSNISLRGVSPRPMVDTAPQQQPMARAQQNGGPFSERTYKKTTTNKMRRRKSGDGYK